MRTVPFTESVASAEAARGLITASLDLATGEYWLEDVAGVAPSVEYITEPADEWGRKVDSIETPFAGEYDEEEYQNPALQMLNLAELRMLARALGVRPPWSGRSGGRELQGNRVLDIGCGTGRIALFAAGLGAEEVVAIDQTSSYVEVAAQKASRLPVNVPRPRLLVTPAESLPEGKADVVTAMFGVLNHCRDWQDVTTSLVARLSTGGSFVGSMYGSPEAAVYAELDNGLSYAPAILTRRAPGGLLLGESADDILPATFPYPGQVVEALAGDGLDVRTLQPFLSVTSLYPRQATSENIAEFLNVVRRRYGTNIGSYLGQYQDSPEQLLVASLCADYMVPKSRIDEAAYFGVVATKPETTT